MWIRAVPGIVADGLGTSLMTRFLTGPNSEISMAFIVAAIVYCNTNYGFEERIWFLRVLLWFASIVIIFL
jgi:hypothetical protein